MSTTTPISPTVADPTTAPEQATGPTAATETRPLTTADRCDVCGAQAYLRVVLASGELLFCAHHGHAHRDALERQALFIQDESDRLTRSDEVD
ncbi:MULTISPECIES: hypothetical protein [Actinomyces]|uniref:DUF7455 domain-containing protein n=2 Tax=Actinomyces TaxID=1654 RepID=A0A1M4S1R5_9ACTO|nr:MULTISPECIES: hypothetical protein [Actinomyces]MBE6475128.1 hypothetical protein [Actinomyces succiniciruminis]MBM6978752.1 hypothetical protein [Actinomyces succiniciruminis]RAX22768.1 hypothetical protein DRB06_03525 [Actinomyces sp. Z5]RAX23426.1 hypothetical protein DRB07_04375 [Actinomyces sp. Z3]CED91177.1 Hypothetical protein AAM4_1345 [Actinomyces succiniciruminis]